MIKEEVSNQLIKAVKESAIDCAIYSRAGGKEQLHCLQFGEPRPGDFSYKPSLQVDNPDSVAKINKKVLEWSGKEITLLGKVYIYRKIDSRRGNIYDLDSYKQAQRVPGVEPIMIGTLEKDTSGKMVFKKV